MFATDRQLVGREHNRVLDNKPGHIDEVVLVDADIGKGGGKEETWGEAVAKDTRTLSYAQLQRNVPRNVPP
jgi:hypothetical protein